MAPTRKPAWPGNSFVVSNSVVGWSIGSLLNILAMSLDWCLGVCVKSNILTSCIQPEWAMAAAGGFRL